MVSATTENTICFHSVCYYKLYSRLKCQNSNNIISFIYYRHVVRSKTNHCASNYLTWNYEFIECIVSCLEEMVVDGS